MEILRFRPLPTLLVLSLLAVLQNALWVAVAASQDDHCVEYQRAMRFDYGPNGAQSVNIDGQLAYFAKGGAGFLIVDISDPDDPTIAANVSWHESRNAADVFADGARCCVAAKADGMRVFDVSNPFQPALAGSLATNDEAHAVFVAGDLAYLVGPDLGLLVVDITDPELPTVLGSANTSGGSLDVVVDGGMAYVADTESGLLLIDVSNPSQPAIVGAQITQGDAQAVAIEGDLAYVADGSDGLLIVDLSASPQLSIIGSVDTPGMATGVFVAGSKAFVADQDSNLQVIDVLDPTDPTLESSIEIRGSANDVACVEDYAFVAASSGALAIDHVVATAPPPPTLGLVATAGPTRSLVAVGNRAYVLNDAAGLQILQVTDTSSGEVVGSINPGYGVNALAVHGDYAYLVSSYSDNDDKGLLQIIDVADPTSPFLVSTTPVHDSFRTYFSGGVAAGGQYAYVTGELVGAGRSFVVFDVRDPEAPTVVSESVGGLGSSGKMILSGKVLFVVSCYHDCSISVLDISDPRYPHFLSSIYSWSVSGLAYFGDHLFVGERVGPRDLDIVDVSDPTQPLRIATIDDTGHKIAALGNRVYASNGSATYGLDILDVSAPDDPVLTGDFDLSSEITHLAVSSNYVFAAMESSGVFVAYRQCDDAAVSVGPVAPAPRSGIVLSSSPNPFESGTTIQYDLPVATAVRLEIYGVAGRRLRTLYEGAGEAGHHVVPWDGRNDAGNAVAAGVYFAQLTAGGQRARQRVTLIR